MPKLAHVCLVIYVWADGGNDANQGDNVQPYRTIEKAVAVANGITDAEVVIHYLPPGMRPSLVRPWGEW